MIQRFPAVFALEHGDHALLIGGPARDIAEHFARSSTFARAFGFRAAKGSLRVATLEQRHAWECAAAQANPAADIVVTRRTDA